MEWIKRWNAEVSSKPILPGVWARKDGGFIVRARATCPRTDKTFDLVRTLRVATAELALVELRTMIDRVVSGNVPTQPVRPRFSEYAAQLMEHKVAVGELKSAKSREKWASILTCHLIPAFGDFYIDSIRRTDVEGWKRSIALRFGDTLSPHTANGWLATLRVVIDSAVAELELDRNPMAGVKPFDASEWVTYTEEEPNSLMQEEVPVFLECMQRLFPQHYAMVRLGFATGWRPSSMRPLRRRGENADVLWDKGVILIRRSHTRHDEVMATTKTGRHQRVAVPESLLDILREHVDSLEGVQAESDLLFPSELGGFRSASVLDKPFEVVTKACGFRKRITPRAMRRTFQDLCRSAEIKDLVTRSISGHATETMQHHYSTVNAAEQRAAMDKVVNLATYRAGTAEVVNKVVNRMVEKKEPASAATLTG